MSLPRKTLGILLAIYVAVLFCTALVLRDPMEQAQIHRTLFWGFHKGSQALWSNLINIGAFVPVGLLVGLIAGKYRVLKAAAAGLFLSESFECLQLITLRGVFDVDDLFTNLTGALLGGLAGALFVRLKSKG